MIVLVKLSLKNIFYIKMAWWAILKWLISNEPYFYGSFQFFDIKMTFSDFALEISAYGVEKWQLTKKRCSGFFLRLFTKKLFSMTFWHLKYKFYVFSIFWYEDYVFRLCPWNFDQRYQKMTIDLKKMFRIFFENFLQNFCNFTKKMYFLQKKCIFTIFNIFLSVQ